MPSSLGNRRNSPAHRRRPDKTAHRLRDDRVTAGLAAPTHELDPGRIPMSKQKRRGGCGGAVGQPDALHRTLTNLDGTLRWVIGPRVAAGDLTAGSRAVGRAPGWGTP